MADLLALAEEMHFATKFEKARALRPCAVMLKACMVCVPLIASS